jgi:hypothetical protein
MDITSDDRRVSILQEQTQSNIAQIHGIDPRLWHHEQELTFECE